MLLGLEKIRVIHSVKTALACLLGYFVTKTIHFPIDQWLVITVLVVMCAQINVGGMLQKSYMRFFGTFAGSLFAALIIFFLGTKPIILGSAIGLAAIIFSYFATSKSSISESGTLGGVTVAIILIGTDPTVFTAAERFTEITIGIVIAALVSQFILPIHARSLLRDKQVETLRQLHQYYVATLTIDDSTEHQYLEIDDAVAKSLITQRRLVTEALREPFAKKENVVTHFYNLLRCERDMLRAITFMHRIEKESPASKQLFSSQDAKSMFHDKVNEAFEKVAVHLENKTKTPLILDPPNIELIKNIVTSNQKDLNDNDITYARAYLFCAEVVSNRLIQILDFLY